MFYNLQNNGLLSPIFYGFAFNHADYYEDIIKLKKKSFLHFQTLAGWRVRLLLLLDTEMLQYEGSGVPLKLLLVGVLHNA